MAENYRTMGKVWTTIGQLYMWWQRGITAIGDCGVALITQNYNRSLLKSITITLFRSVTSLTHQEKCNFTNYTS